MNGNNLLNNGGFEGDWGEESSHRCLVFPEGAAPYEQDIGSIFTPPGWLTWFRHKPGTWDQPEVRDAHLSGDPDRVLLDLKGIMLFTFSRCHDAGFLQQVKVEPGTTVRLTGWAHAWSNHKDRGLPDKFPHPDDGDWSEGPGYEAGFCYEGETEDDNWRNFTFYLGIDPTGGTDPFADTVVWGKGAHIYNKYARVPEVEATAQGDTVTVFLRDKTLWPFKHNDAYWDAIRLVMIDEPQPTPEPPPVPEPEPQRGLPRTQYARAYLLLPQRCDQLWAICAITAVWDQFRFTLGSSADDAGIGDLDVRRVLAVNPHWWIDSSKPADGQMTLQEFYDTYYEGVELVPVYARTAYELAIRLRPPALGPINLSQNDARWRNEDMGELAGGETIGEIGCLLTCFTMMLTKAYGRHVSPLLVNDLLVLADTVFEYDDVFVNWHKAAQLFPAFIQSIKVNGPQTLASLQELLLDGWLIALRFDGTRAKHFVYLVSAGNDNLGVIDPWDGKAKTKPLSAVDGIRGVRIKKDAPPPSLPPKLQIGFHDESGGKYMVDNDIPGCCLVHTIVQRNPRQLDYSHLAENDIKVICRLNWGYADGAGCFPPPQFKDDHVRALVDTIKNTTGVHLFTIGNEPNNAGEHPDGYVLAPQYCMEIYNAVYDGLGEELADRVLCPPALDPFFGPGSDNSIWWRYFLEHMKGAAALLLHTAKTQTNDHNLVRSDEKFKDKPLTWQYLNCRSMQTYLQMVPNKWQELPVYLTEANPQHLFYIGGELGWLPDNTEWIHELCEYVREYNETAAQSVMGICFYRFDMGAGNQAAFSLGDQPALLAQIEAEAETIK